MTRIDFFGERGYSCGENALFLEADEVGLGQQVYDLSVSPVLLQPYVPWPCSQ